MFTRVCRGELHSPDVGREEGPIFTHVCRKKILCYPGRGRDLGPIFPGVGKTEAPLVVCVGGGNRSYVLYLPVLVGTK
jgi:hypothetical protein